MSAAVFQFYALEDGEGQLAVSLPLRREEGGAETVEVVSWWTNKTLANYSLSL